MDIHVPGLDVIGPIARGGQAMVFRARREQKDFAVKLPRLDAGGSAARDDLVRFRREAGILARVRHPALPEIMEIGAVDAGVLRGTPYMVMEYVEGRTLASVLARGPLPERTVIDVGKQLADALAAVHAHGLVHRDVKPANILLEESGRAKLIDFGIAAPAETRSNASADFEGTLVYAAPEQAGSIDRPIDARADLYALGVVLFHCATGEPPFRSKDEREMVRLHARELPPRIKQRRPEASAALDRLIDKLLAKDPDARYQSGKGVAADLERIAALDEAIERGEEPVLGALDELGGATGGFSLVGRDAELESLRRHHEESIRGRGAVVLLNGHAGTGKSRLALELVREVRRPRGAGEQGTLALVGRCAFGDPVPFGPWREIAEEYVRWLDRAAEPVRRDREARIRASAGMLAPVLEHLSPGLASRLATPEMAAKRPAAQATSGTREQFQGAVAELLTRAAQVHGGLLVVIDDAQWLDDASLQVLRRLLPRLAEAPVLLVLAARDEEGSIERLEKLAAEAGGVRAHVTLSALDETHVRNLLSAHLGGYAVAPALVGKIAARSLGSPLVVRESLHAMLDAGLLRPSWGTWIADDEELERFPLTTDAMDVIRARLQALAPRTRLILVTAAVCGSRFSLDVMVAACRASLADVHVAVADALRAQLVEPAAKGEYQFVHDRVREALLSPLGGTERMQEHQRLAEALDEVGGDGPGHVYALARHYARGTDEKRARVHATNLDAGLRALAEHANEEAYAFLGEAERTADAAGERAAELAVALGEACARTGRLAQATSEFGRAVETCAEPVRRASLRARLARVHLAKFEAAPARQELGRAFEDLGATVPRSAFALILWTLAYWMIGQIGMRARRPTVAKVAVAERHRALVVACEIGGTAAYLDGNDFLLLHMSIRPMWAVHQLGVCRELADFYANHAALTAVLKLAATAERYAARALRIAGQLGDPQCVARCTMYHALAKHFSGSPVEAAALSRKNLDDSGRWLDAGDYLDASGDLVWNLCLRGHAREAWNGLRRALVRVGYATSSSDLRYGWYIYAAAILTMLRRDAEADKQLERFETISASAPKERFRWADSMTFLVAYHLEKGQLGAPLDGAIEQYAAVAHRPERAPFHLRHFYVFQAWARLAQLEATQDAAASRGDRLRELRRALADLRRAANHPTLLCHWLVLEGILARIEGEAAKAAERIDAAHDLATRIESVWVLSEVGFERARVLRARGDHAGAQREAVAAEKLAREHGWVTRAIRIQKTFDLEAGEPGTTDSTSPDTTVVETPRKGKSSRR